MICVTEKAPSAAYSYGGVCGLNSGTGFAYLDRAGIQRPVLKRPQKGEHPLKPIRSIAMTWMVLVAMVAGFGAGWEAHAFDPGPQLNTVQPEAAPYYLALSASGAVTLPFCAAEPKRSSPTES